jgi:outer membrane protein assembly factor BamB
VDVGRITVTSMVASAGLLAASAFASTAPAAESAVREPDEVSVTVRWRSEGVVRRPRMPPTAGNAVAAGGRVYLAGDERGRVVALDRGSGDVRWSVRSGRDEWTVIMGATPTTIVLGDHDHVWAIDDENGRTRWELSLSALGFNGYRPASSVITEPMSAIGVSARGEGEWPPPAVLGVATADGSLRWRTDLTPGTELTHPPAATDGTDTVFVTTPSGPERGDNIAHLLALDSGRMHWATTLGGFQAFGVLPALLGDESVLLQPVRTSADIDPATSTGRTTGVGRSDGVVRWTTEGTLLTRVGRELWGVDTTGAIEVLDERTGEPARTVRAPRPARGRFPPLLVDLGGGRVGVVEGAHFTVVDHEGRRLAAARFRTPLVAPLIVERGGVIAVTTDDVTTAYGIA